MARVDTSIYGQNPLRSVMDYAGQFDQADLRKQQLKQNSLAFDDRQRGIQESNALRQALAQGVDPRDPAGQTKLMQIAPNAAGPVIKSLGDAAHVAATTRKSSADADAATFDLQVKKANKAIADIAALTSPEEAAKGIKEQLASGHLDQQKAQALLSGLPQDPAGFAQWQRKMLLAIMDAKDKLVATKPAFAFERAGGNIVPVQTNTDAGPVGQTAEMPAIPITQSADNIATNATSASNNAANNARMAAEGAANRANATTIAGMVDARSREANAAKIAEKTTKEDEKKAGAKADAESVISTLRAQYNVLEGNGAITSTNRGALENIGASIGSSAVGQAFGRAVGTESQSARNQIVMARPALVSAIVRATGMSAKSIDSNAELKLMLMTATDPTLDVQANRAALDRLEQSLVSGQFKAEPKAPTSPSLPAMSDIDAELARRAAAKKK